jgi:formimidoylglutamate deiminase
VVLDDFTTIDQYIFNAGRSAVRDVIVGGAWVVRDRRHDGEEEARIAYQRVLSELP